MLQIPQPGQSVPGEVGPVVAALEGDDQRTDHGAASGGEMVAEGLKVADCQLEGVERIVHQPAFAVGLPAGQKQREAGVPVRAFLRRDVFGRIDQAAGAGDPLVDGMTVRLLGFDLDLAFLDQDSIHDHGPNFRR